MIPPTPQNRPVIILGGGLAGLSTLWYLQRSGHGNCTLFEKESRVGGLARSETINGFTFDYTGHLLHFHSSSIQDLVHSLLNGNLHRLNRESWIYSHQRYSRYPFQSNLFGLPAPVIKECILEYVRAPGFRLSANDPIPPYEGPSNFESWVLFAFGKGLARHFLLPYNEKLWTVPCRELSCDWMGRFVPQTSLEQILSGALSDEAEKSGYNAFFSYPLQGGIEELPRKMAGALANWHCNQECSEIDLEAQSVRFQAGDRHSYHFLVTTIPLPFLIKICRRVPEEIRAAAQKLRWVSVLNLNFGIDRPMSGKHWIYVPESPWLFYRLGFQHNFSPFLAPSGCGSVYIEIAHPADQPLDPGVVSRQVREQLHELGILRKTDKILAECHLKIPTAYVIYDQEHARAVQTVQDYLKSRNVYSIGRYGAWEYSSMEDALSAGAETAQEIQTKLRIQ